MNLVPHPRLLSPAESPGEHSQGVPANFYPLAIDVLRDAMGRFQRCRSLDEVLGLLVQCATLMRPSVQLCLLLRQPDACFEVVQCAPERAREGLRQLSEQLIESGRFAQALQTGDHLGSPTADQTCLLLSLATPRRIYGMAIFVDHQIPRAMCQPLGALIDVASLYIERLHGDPEQFTAGADPGPTRDGYPAVAKPFPNSADLLTGLAHRSQFIRFLQRAILDRRARDAVGTLLLDIDGFHRVNREFGCEAGDRVLRDVALRLDGALRSRFVYDRLGIAECDLCFARTGGDEFGIAIARLRHPGHLGDLAIHLHSHLAEGFQQNGHRLHLSVSIGVAAADGDDDTCSAQTLLRSTDTALKRAKGAGRNQHAVYEAAWDESGSSHLRTESLLQEALRHDHFTLHIQPIFRLQDGTLASAEVLLRLRLGDGAPLPPSTFIPVAESTGQIVEIGEWVLRHSCRLLHAWDGRGIRHIPLAINVSAIELCRSDLAGRFLQILEEERTPVARLHLEITETALALNENQALANLRALRAAGFEVWIDDFGTGYSSLKSLKNFPVSGLKLDQDFVRDLAHNPAAKVITRSILTMARDLGYPVIAEGIEGADQLQFLQQHGCHSGQGFHLGHPAGAATFETLYLRTPAAPSPETDAPR